MNTSISSKIDPKYHCISKALVKDFPTYQAMYEQSIKEPLTFWEAMANDNIHFFSKWTAVHVQQNSINIWFQGSTTNACYNCLDKHILAHNEHKIAYHFQGNDPKISYDVTYGELYKKVNEYACALKVLGVTKGDTITIFMPTIIEAVESMLACARIGAIHSFIFGGFSAESLRSRLIDAESKVVITTDGSCRGPKLLKHKDIVDEAIKTLDFVKHVIVIKKACIPVHMTISRDVYLDELISRTKDKECQCVAMKAEDPLFLLYTSGSTGKPKGIIHSTAGYIVYASVSHKYIFDYHPEDIYMCTGDLGWITGHTYNVYGPLINGCTSVLFEGVPFYPDWGRYWEIVQKFKVNIFYTAPTAIRAIAKEGESWVKKYDLSSLRVLGSVGEPINYQAWMWYYEIIGKSRCSIVDTWWQTETGGIVLTGLPGVTQMKPGSASLPFFGCKPVILDEAYKEKVGEASGLLAIMGSWPGQLIGIFKNASNQYENYFKNGYFVSGDTARRDSDGYIWITGRIDDVIKISGHRIESAEIECAVSSSTFVAEAAVVGVPHSIKGNSVTAFIILKPGIEPSENMKKELNIHLRNVMGPIVTMDEISFVLSLPKTRSGKIMRRVLRKMALGETDIGDVSTMDDDQVVITPTKKKCF